MNGHCIKTHVVPDRHNRLGQRSNHFLLQWKPETPARRAAAGAWRIVRTDLSLESRSDSNPGGHHLDSEQSGYGVSVKVDPRHGRMDCQSPFRHLVRPRSPDNPEDETWTKSPDTNGSGVILLLLCLPGITLPFAVVNSMMETTDGPRRRSNQRGTGNGEREGGLRVSRSAFRMGTPFPSVSICIAISKSFVSLRKFSAQVIPKRGRTGTCSVGHLPSSIFHFLWLRRLPRWVNLWFNCGIWVHEQLAAHRDPVCRRPEAVRVPARAGVASPVTAQ